MPFLSALIGGLLALGGVFITQRRQDHREKAAWGRTESATANKEFLEEFQRMWEMGNSSGAHPGAYEHDMIEPLMTRLHTLALFARKQTVERAREAVRALDSYLASDTPETGRAAWNSREGYLNAVREEFGLKPHAQDL